MVAPPAPARRGEIRPDLRSSFVLVSDEKNTEVEVSERQGVRYGSASLPYDTKVTRLSQSGFPLTTCYPASV